MTFVSFNYKTLNLQPIVWLFVQSLSLYIAYLTFQTIFFDRFIACFRINGNVGFFIAIIDFIGYVGTVSLLSVKELLSVELEGLHSITTWLGVVGIFCTVLFTVAGILIYRKYPDTRFTTSLNTEKPYDLFLNTQYNTI